MSKGVDSVLDGVSSRILTPSTTDVNSLDLWSLQMLSGQDGVTPS